jgi:hypothetical protein
MKETVYIFQELFCAITFERYQCIKPVNCFIIHTGMRVRAKGGQCELFLNFVFLD